MKSSSIGVETSRSTPQSDSIVRQTNIFYLPKIKCFSDQYLLSSSILNSALCFENSFNICQLPLLYFYTVVVPISAYTFVTIYQEILTLNSCHESVSDVVNHLFQKSTHFVFVSPKH